jgi:hypothetical protein
MKIRCDYCEAVATRFIQRGKPTMRSFTCEIHYERGREAVWPPDHFQDPPQYDRSALDSMRRDSVESIWRRGARAELRRLRKRQNIG